LSFRLLWADYLEKEGTQYAFFSASNAAALLEAKRIALEGERRDDMRSVSSKESTDNPETPSDDDSESIYENDEISNAENKEKVETFLESDVPENNTGWIDEGDNDTNPRTRVLSVLELESLFLRTAPLSNREYKGSPSIITWVNLTQYKYLLMHQGTQHLNWLLVLSGILMWESLVRSMHY
jgi:hypothetical protein